MPFLVAWTTQRSSCQWSILVSPSSQLDLAPVNANPWLTKWGWSLWVGSSECYLLLGELSSFTLFFLLSISTIPLVFCFQKTISKHEKLVRNFFGGEYNEHKMKTIAWKKICTPKSQGGLEIRSIVDIGTAALTCRTWFIARRRKSIWTSWGYSNYIKDRSFWDLKTPSNCLWGWRGILGKRN